jgi:hypothetical protein
MSRGFIPLYFKIKLKAVLFVCKEYVAVGLHA